MTLMSVFSSFTNFLWYKCRNIFLSSSCCLYCTVFLFKFLNYISLPKYSSLAPPVPPASICLGLQLVRLIFFLWLFAVWTPCLKEYLIYLYMQIKTVSLVYITPLANIQWRSLWSVTYNWEEDFLKRVKKWRSIEGSHDGVLEFFYLLYRRIGLKCLH